MERLNKSAYEVVQGALALFMCGHCKGSGERDDGEPGDSFYRTWKCDECKGTGFSGGAIPRVSFDQLVATKITEGT